MLKRTVGLENTLTAATDLASALGDTYLGLEHMLAVLVVTEPFANIGASLIAAKQMTLADVFGPNDRRAALTQQWAAAREASARELSQAN